MKLVSAPALALASVLLGCSGTDLTGSDACTVQAVGEETGAGNLQATLMVPERYFSGVEISNGGIMIHWDGCDFSLNAFLSDDTANAIINDAPHVTLTDAEHDFRLVRADLSIWKFTDGSGEPRFFVTRVHELQPITRPRNAMEAQRYEVPRAGR